LNKLQHHQFEESEDYIDSLQDGVAIYTALSGIDATFWPDKDIGKTDMAFNKLNFMTILRGFLNFFG
jgi:hypothetical protein